MDDDRTGNAVEARNLSYRDSGHLIGLPIHPPVSLESPLGIVGSDQNEQRLVTGDSGSIASCLTSGT